MSSENGQSSAPSASRCYAVQLLDAVDLSQLEKAQRATLLASDMLHDEIEKTLDPILLRCNTPDEVLAVKAELRNRLQCSLDGLMEVHFAVAYVGREYA